MIHYWIVGKTWAGEDQAQRFYSLGKWEMGYEEAEVPKYDKKIAQIKAGDRLAVKHMNGKGQKDITIVAIGIVKGIEERVVYVDWIVKDLNRKVPSRGCFGTLHGPYTYKNAWTRQVFCL